MRLAFFSQHTRRAKNPSAAGARLAETRTNGRVARQRTIEKNGSGIVFTVHDNRENAGRSGSAHSSDRVAWDTVAQHLQGRRARDPIRNLEADLSRADVVHSGSKAVHRYLHATEVGRQSVS